MDEFAESLVARVRDARKVLGQAVEAGDSGTVAAALDELEVALLAARKHGVEVPAAETASDA